MGGLKRDYKIFQGGITVYDEWLNKVNAPPEPKIKTRPKPAAKSK